MYKLTETELAMWQHPYPHKCTISSDNFSLTESDICSGGFTLDRRSVSGNRIEIGSVIASELSLTVDNYDGRWNATSFEGASIYVSVSVTDGVNTNIVPMGYFVIDNSPRRLTRISLTAFDRMMQFDRVYKGDITFPTTPATLVSRVCEICDVPMADMDYTELPNYDVAIQAVEFADGTTYREILSRALEIMGVCGWANWDGEFVCGWYDVPDDNTLEITPSNRTASDIYEEAIEIDGVKVDEFITEDATYAINIENNPFIDDTNREDVMTNLYTALNGFTYHIASATVLPCPHVWPMDMLTFVKNNTDYPIIVSGMTYRMNGSTAIESSGETLTENGYAAANPLTKAETVFIKKELELAESQLSERVTEMSSLNDIALNSLGYHTTLEKQADGSLIEYTHDKATLEESTIIYKKNSQGFFLSRDGGETYEAGFDSDGNAVLNILSVNGIKADWLIAGILKDKADGQNFWLNLDTGELKIGNGTLHYLNGVLSLGDETSVHVALDNDSMDIVDGGTTVASFSATVSLIPRMQVNEYLHMGSNWEVSQTGGFSIKWIGGN